MKVKIQSDDASTLRKDGWSQAGDWLAELRDDSRCEPLGDSRSRAAGADVPWPEALAQADALAEARARAASGYPPVIRAEREWHHYYLPNAQAVPAGRYVENPAATLIRAAWPWNSARARRACGRRQAAAPTL